MGEPQTVSGFLLTRDWRDTARGTELRLWAATGSGPLRIVVPEERPVCFIRRRDVLRLPANTERAAVNLRAFDGEPVDALYFQDQASLRRTRDAAAVASLALFESELKPADRYVMERFVTAGFTAYGTVQNDAGGRFREMTKPRLEPSLCAPALTAAAIDIETGADGELYSIAVSGPGGDAVFMLCRPGEVIPAGDRDFEVSGHTDEASLLQAFFARVSGDDPDLLLGWNVVDFDLSFLDRTCRRLGRPFELARGGEACAVLEPRERNSGRIARVPGRAVLDGIDSLRSAFWSFENFSLECVARELLGRGKQMEATAGKVAQIESWFRRDKPRLAAYNIEDCRLVTAIFDKTALIAFVAERSRMTGLSLGRYGGSVAAFDHLYLPRLHRRGFVAPDVGGGGAGGESPGGYVMDSAPGLYDHVALLDFKSLYPSIIRTFHVDPLALVAPGEPRTPGFNGASFAREQAILPELIEAIWAQRDQAKRDGNQPLAQAAKILMNSFYGVLGTPGCRFFDPRLASSITRRGHEIITRSRRFIESLGYKVIYGDTDSLFVRLGAGQSEAEAGQTGRNLASTLNQWWTVTLEKEYGLHSYLEVQLESLFLRFLMPTVRGAAAGSKKRYAGYVRNAAGEFELVFKGLESVRTDWTPLARRFQRELYRRVFFNEPYEDYIRQTAADLARGALDAELVYRKRLRRRVGDYRVNVPPHVQAARKLARPGAWVSYVMTPRGPEPVQNAPRGIDYEHYRDKQLKPVADGILHFLDTDFDRITGAQLTLF